MRNPRVGKGVNRVLFYRYRAMTLSIELGRVVTEML